MSMQTNDNSLMAKPIAKKQSLHKQVKTIAKQINEYKTQADDAGLLGGKAGITLLYAYLSKIFPGEDYLQTTFDYLDELGDALANEGLHYNMSSGVAGIAFVFQHLRNMGILNTDDDLNLLELDAFIDRGMDFDFASGNWDPLHGLAGLGIYFLERNKETGEKKYLEKVVDLLANTRTVVGDCKVWVTPAFEKVSNDNYNFGMAHGIPGIISFLSQVHQRGIQQKEIEEILNTCLPFLLQHEYIDHPVYCFPAAIDTVPVAEEATGARLAWCYGDLSMAMALIHAGTALKNDAWKNKGIEVALKTTKRTLQNAACTDAPFCHGSTGIVHQYNRLYRLAGLHAFKQAAEKWIDITTKHFYTPGKFVGGYYSGSFNEEKKTFELTSQSGLLDGSAGIALVYLSYFYDVEPDWDIIFLTNV